MWALQRCLSQGLRCMPSGCASRARAELLAGGMASFFWDRHALACWRSGELPTVAGEWRCAVGELSGRAPRLPGPPRA